MDILAQAILARAQYSLALRHGCLRLTRLATSTSLLGLAARSDSPLRPRGSLTPADFASRASGGGGVCVAMAGVFRCRIDIATIESLEQKLIWLRDAQRRQPALDIEMLRAAPQARGSVARVWSRRNAAQAPAQKWVRERRVAAEVIKLVEARLAVLQHKLSTRVEEEESGLLDVAVAAAASKKRARRVPLPSPPLPSPTPP